MTDRGTPEAARGRTIASRIARFYEAPPAPREARGGDAQFWWQQSRGNAPRTHPSPAGKDSTAGRLTASPATDTQHFDQRSKAGGSGAYPSVQAGHTSPVSATARQASPSDTQHSDVADVLQDLAATNPALLSVLAGGLERDASGRLSTGTLERIQRLLAGGQGSPGRAPGSPGGSVSSSGPASPSLALPPSVGGRRTVDTEDSTDSLMAAINRYRHEPARPTASVTTTSSGMPPAPSAQSFSFSTQTGSRTAPEQPPGPARSAAQSGGQSTGKAEAAPVAVGQVASAAAGVAAAIAMAAPVAVPQAASMAVPQAPQVPSGSAASLAASTATQSAPAAAAAAATAAAPAAPVVPAAPTQVAPAAQPPNPPPAPSAVASEVISTHPAQQPVPAAPATVAAAANVASDATSKQQVPPIAVPQGTGQAVVAQAGTPGPAQPSPPPPPASQGVSKDAQSNVVVGSVPVTAGTVASKLSEAESVPKPAELAAELSFSHPPAPAAAAPAAKAAASEPQSAAQGVAQAVVPPPAAQDAPLKRAPSSGAPASAAARQSSRSTSPASARGRAAAGPAAGTPTAAAPVHVAGALPPPPQHLEKIYQLAVGVGSSAASGSVAAASSPSPASSPAAAAPMAAPATAAAPSAPPAQPAAVPVAAAQQVPTTAASTAAAKAPGSAAAAEQSSKPAVVAAPGSDASKPPAAVAASQVAAPAQAAAATSSQPAIPTIAATPAGAPSQQPAPTSGSITQALQASGPGPSISANTSAPTAAAAATSAPAAAPPTAHASMPPVAAVAQPAKPASQGPAAVGSPAGPSGSPQPVASVTEAAKSVGDITKSVTSDNGSLDLSKGWPANVPHGPPVILPGTSGVSPPMIFVPSLPPSPSPSPPRSPSHSPLATNPLYSPTHVFIPTHPGLPPQLLSLPGHPSYPLPQASPTPASPPRAAQVPVAAAGSTPAQSAASPLLTPAPLPPPASSITFQPLQPPAQQQPNKLQPAATGSAAADGAAGKPAAATAPQAAAAGGATAVAAGGPAGAAAAKPDVTVQPPAAAAPSGPAAGGSAAAKPQAPAAAGGAPAPAAAAASSAPAASAATPVPSSVSTGNTANSASTGPASSASKDTPSGTNAPTTAAAAAKPAAEAAAPAAAAAEATKSTPVKKDGEKPQETEATRRAQDITDALSIELRNHAENVVNTLKLESQSPPVTRLSRLVNEVESTRRRAKEEAIRREEKAKLQKMKWDELEGYLGIQATAVQDIRKLKWDNTTLTKEIGSVPPKKLAAQFLEQAEAIRAAAIGAAVERELERAAHHEELARRDAERYHTVMDMQHALSLASHRHAIDKAETLGEATRTLIDSPHHMNARPTFLTTSYWSRSVGSSPVRPGAGSVHHLTTTASAASPLGVPATGTGALANPDWYRQLLSQSANEHKPPLSPPGAPATGSESDDSSSSSSSSDDSSQSRSDFEKKKGSKRGARESASKGQGKSGGDVHKAPKGGEESAPVESLRETARRVSTQLDSVVNQFLKRTVGLSSVTTTANMATTDSMARSARSPRVASPTRTTPLVHPATTAAAAAAVPAAVTATPACLVMDSGDVLRGLGINGGLLAGAMAGGADVSQLSQTLLLVQQQALQAQRAALAAQQRAIEQQAQAQLQLQQQQQLYQLQLQAQPPAQQLSPQRTLPTQQTVSAATSPRVFVSTGSAAQEWPLEHAEQPAAAAAVADATVGADSVASVPAYVHAHADLAPAATAATAEPVGQAANYAVHTVPSQVSGQLVAEAAGVSGYAASPVAQHVQVRPQQAADPAVAAAATAVLAASPAAAAAVPHPPQPQPQPAVAPAVYSVAVVPGGPAAALAAAAPPTAAPAYATAAPPAQPQPQPAQTAAAPAAPAAAPVMASYTVTSPAAPPAVYHTHPANTAPMQQAVYTHMSPRYTTAMPTENTGSLLVTTQPMADSMPPLPVYASWPGLGQLPGDGLPYVTSPAAPALQLTAAPTAPVYAAVPGHGAWGAAAQGPYQAHVAAMSMQAMWPAAAPHTHNTSPAAAAAAASAPYSPTKHNPYLGEIPRMAEPRIPAMPPVSHAQAEQDNGPVSPDSTLNSDAQARDAGTQTVRDARTTPGRHERARGVDSTTQTPPRAVSASLAARGVQMGGVSASPVHNGAGTGAWQGQAQLRGVAQAAPAVSSSVTRVGGGAAGEPWAQYPPAPPPVTMAGTGHGVRVLTHPPHVAFGPQHVSLYAPARSVVPQQPSAPPQYWPQGHFATARPSQAVPPVPVAVIPSPSAASPWVNLDHQARAWAAGQGLEMPSPPVVEASPGAEWNWRLAGVPVDQVPVALAHTAVRTQAQLDAVYGPGVTNAWDLI